MTTKQADGGRAMNFDFDETQGEIRTEIRRFLDENCSYEKTRSSVDGDAAYDEGLWSQLGELGYLGIAVAEEYDGTGLGILELCILAEEIGRHLAPIPFVSSICMATVAIDRLGSTDQKQSWLPRLASGSAIGTAALADLPGQFCSSRVKTRIDGGRLYGQKFSVPFGSISDVAIVAACQEGPGGQPTLFLVELDQDAICLKQSPTVDLTQRVATIEFNGADCTALGDCSDWSAVEDFLNVAAVLLSFVQIGGADRALEVARDFSLERSAFGRQIGSFQALKHRMADIFVSNTLARSNAYCGAWALNTNDVSLPVAAAAARLSASQAFQVSSRECIQIHGGMGFTWEMDPHLYYRRSNNLANALNGPTFWGRRLVNLLAAEDASEESAIENGQQKEATIAA